MPGGVSHVKGRDKRGLNSVQHCGKNCGFVPEAHLALGRVHVDVHLRRVHFHKKHYLRIVTAGHAALVGFAHGGQQAFVRNGSAVDIEQDAVAARLAHIGQGRQTVCAYAVPLAVKGAQGVHHKPWPEDGEPPGKGLPRQKTQGLAIARMQAEAHLWPGERQTRQPVLGAFELRGGGL